LTDTELKKRGQKKIKEEQVSRCPVAGRAPEK
jgi:hypothetical protein